MNVSCLIVETLTVTSVEGEKTLPPGHMISISNTKVAPLIEKGKVMPVEKVAHKLNSELLGVHLWVVGTTQDVHALRAQGVIEAIYTADEVRGLKGADKRVLVAVHDVKNVFDLAIVEEYKQEQK